jgi:hypothetical protein
MLREGQKQISLFASMLAMLRWVASNPLQTIVALLVMQVLLVNSKKEEHKAQGDNPEIDDITDQFVNSQLDLDAQDITDSIQIHSLSELDYRRILQSELECKSEIMPNEGWALAMGGKLDDQVNAMQVRPDGRILLTGYTYSFGAGGSDIFLAQFDTNANLEWANTYGGPKDDFSYDLALASNGDAIVSGYYTGPENNNDIVLLRVDSFGKLVWSKTTGASFNIILRALALSLEEQLIVSGYSYNTPAGSNLFIAKL